MRICFLISGSETGGVATVLSSLSEELQKLNHEIFFLASQKGLFASQMYKSTSVIVNNTSIVNNSAWYFGSIRFPGALQIIKNFKTIIEAKHNLPGFFNNNEVDLIVGNGASSAALLTLCKKNIKPSFVTCLHEIGEVANDLFRFRAMVASGFLNLTDGVAAVSIQALKRFEPFLKVPSRVIYNCPKPQILDREYCKVFKIENQIPENAIIIGGAGRIVFSKGYHILIDAIGHLSLENKNIFCIIAGDFPENIEGYNYKTFLEEKIQKWNLKGRVILTGFLPMKKFLALIDIFCHTFLGYEGLGMTILESMLAGIPTIASIIGGPSEIIKGPSDGLLIVPGNFKVLANKINFLIENPSYMKFLKENSSKRVKNFFNFDNWASNWIEFFDYILNEKKVK